MADPPLEIRCVPLGELQTNCYVAAPTGDDACWVFDPGGAAAALLDMLDQQGWRVARILLTHAHGDHIGGVAEVKAAFPDAIFTVPAGDEHMLADPMANISGMFGMPITAPPADQLVRPGDQLTMGPLIWDVLDTAGHSPGGVTYYCREAALAVVGDALFAQGIGRTDFPGCDHDTFMANIRSHLLTLPDETQILPGHGPTTTIGQEKQVNPFL